MYKRKIMLLIMISIVIIASTITYADNNDSYNLEKMTEKLISENLTILKMDNDVELMKLQYEDTLESYEDLQNTVKSTKKSLELETIQKEQAWERYKDAGSSEKPFQKANYEMRANIYEATLDAYNSIIKQELSMIESMERLELQIEQADRQKEILRLKESYNLQKSYYNLYILKKDIEMLKGDIENLNKQKEIESTKFDLDMSTTENIQNISEKIIEMQLMIDMLENQKELSLESIKTELNIPVEEDLIIEWEIGEVETDEQYSLIELISKFKENSLELKSLDKNIEIKQIILDKSYEVYEDVNDNEIKIAQIKLENAKVDKKVFERNMEMSVKHTYYDFKAKELNLTVKNITEKDYTENEKNLHLRYEQGIISKIQYDMGLHQLKRDKVEYDKAKIEYLNTKRKLDLVKEGIMN